VSFRDWHDALEKGSLSEAERAALRREIVSFLHHCKTRRIPVTIACAKDYLAEPDKGKAGAARAALRWFAEGTKAVRL
jgi:hypothetical protein